MTKYIIELEDDIKYLIINGRADNRCYTLVRPVAELEILNSDYINEHFGQLQDDAYQRGLEDGKAVYDKGCEGCEYEGRTSGQNPCCRCARNADDYWTAKDDKIVVGDEVKPFYTDITGMVTLIDGDTIYVLWRDGSSTSTLKLEEVRKTGRHFDIDKILKEMNDES